MRAHLPRRTTQDGRRANHRLSLGCSLRLGRTVRRRSSPPQTWLAGIPSCVSDRTGVAKQKSLGPPSAVMKAAEPRAMGEITRADEHDRPRLATDLRGGSDTE